MSRKIDKVSKRKPDRSILDMTARKARAFLLKPESYCNIDLPFYFTFEKLLSAVSKVVLGKNLTNLSSKPREHEGVNYSMLSNKDGRHAWRPLQLIHPAIYVSLVDKITEKSGWEIIRARFKEFQSLPNFRCLSIPIESSSGKRDKAAQILNWWQGIEQGSIQLALEYNCVFHADIADCYAAIYTHSIAWALHTKPNAKAMKGDKSLIGNIIDWHIQDMRHGQTNGIPQGLVLMDFISEIVLGYADLDLSKRLREADITEFRVLRYRDDYRIFVQSAEIGEKILKNLTEVLIDLGLKLNTHKTSESLRIVESSVKRDKLAWLRGSQGDRNLQKHLLIIHAHGIDFPNAGSLIVALTQFHERLSKANFIECPSALISIAVDIAYTSPRSFPVCAAIVSNLLAFLESNAERVDVIRKIYNKLSQVPNTGHMEVWLQRISHKVEPTLAYKEKLCLLVKRKEIDLWNNDWITSKTLKAAMNPQIIVNRAKLQSLDPKINPVEIALFKLLGEVLS